MKERISYSSRIKTPNQATVILSHYLDVCPQIFLRNFKVMIEGELKKIVESGGGHMLQVEKALWGLSHSGLGQSLEVLAALWKPAEVHL